MPHQIAAVSQRLAAHPHHSAWVAASAGSGKTKVLTDRVLNLLLEGCVPERILCLTFTKAAAAEMATRVRSHLSAWAIASDHDLQLSLRTLQNIPPSPEKVERARTLFGLTLDTPGGLKIQTIHSFCQSLLKRFPLEAGLSPFFTVMDDTKRKALIQKAFYKVMEDPSFSELALRFSETTFEDFNEFILTERGRFENLKSSSQGLGALPPQMTLENGIKASLPLFQHGSPTDQARGDALTRFLTLSQEDQGERFEEYLSLFFTQGGERRARLLTQKLAKAYPHLEETLEREACRLSAWIEQRNTREVMTVSDALLEYAQNFLKTIDAFKKLESLLDYEDLILKTAALLKNPGCHWVLYKLDGGLDHILVDEAQDTSPSQWQVVRAIAEEFYANAAADPRNRTLFIVGDSKQSIYSFQGADPAVFTQMQQDLRTFAKMSEKKWEDVDLNVSFRSTPEILTLVNAVFPTFSPHLPSRKEAQGHVEVWPLVTKEADIALEAWQLPLTQAPKESPQKRLSQQIAQTIHSWLKGGGPLSRPVTPGDILILVRRRTAFVDILIRALKEYNVPVAGVDRLWLLAGLGVQDLLKIGEFLLLPEDDLTLATVLKGPLFDLSEEDLFTLAHGRKEESLWQRLLRDEKYDKITSVLKDLLGQTDFLTPFALYSHILGPLAGRAKWHAHLGPEVLDSLDEFLNLCLVFQEEKTPSLQGFLQWISEEVIELKRDLDQSNQVRVMTVHGSKGLQAPIVFLPDTTQLPVDLPPFGFHQQSLVWLPSLPKDIPLTKALKQELRDKQREEYWRLLYVALTRAEDALYVCGWEGSAEESWYSRTLGAIQKVGEEFEGGWRLSSVENRENPPPQKEEDLPFLLPQWLKTNPAFEATPKLVLPSQEEEESIHTPSLYGDFGQMRGTLIHKLLEILPNVEEARREKAALRYLCNEGVSEDRALNILSSAQKVIKVYPDLFGPSSRGEVPFMGYLEDSLLSGQIDRLIITDETILIVDFKTHGIVPETLDKIPKTYIKQMAFYHTALAAMYPDRLITCALLWTEVPRLDLLPEALFSIIPNLIRDPIIMGSPLLSSRT